jgi:hypothetical protein
MKEDKGWICPACGFPFYTLLQLAQHTCYGRKDEDKKTDAETASRHLGELR